MFLVLLDALLASRSRMYIAYSHKGTRVSSGLHAGCWCRSSPSSWRWPWAACGMIFLLLVFAARGGATGAVPGHSGEFSWILGRVAETAVELMVFFERAISQLCQFRPLLGSSFLLLNFPLP
ncbi:MAG: hypothetical protein WKG07_35545 [Hymenobacter sp.]